MSIIYCKNHNVIVVSSGLEKSVQVKIEIENINRDLNIKLTDEDCLSFLFCLKINQENFLEIKTQQGLLVDFNAFGQKVIDLLEMCKQEETSSNPKYILKLIGNCDLNKSISISNYGSLWVLNFIETNPFKHLTHLSLKFQFGDAEQFKEYLIDCLKKCRLENNRLNSNLDSTQSSLNKKLQDTECSLRETKERLQYLQNSNETQIEELKTKMDQMKSKYSDKLIETESYYKSKYDQDRKDLEENSQCKLSKLEFKMQDLEKTNKCLCEENSKLEFEIRDLKLRYDSLNESYQSTNHDISNVRQSREQAQRTIHEMECEAHKINTKIAVLEQEVKDKDESILRLQTQIMSEQEAKNRYYEDYQKKIRQAEKYEKAVKNLNDEVNKGNEIIQKLQSDLKHCQSKIKIRNQITTEQEKVIQERDKQMKQKTEEANKMDNQLMNNKAEIEKLTSQLQSTTKKLEEANQINKTNENVINWLNRQVTEYELLKQKIPPSTGGIVPSNGATHKLPGDPILLAGKYRSPSALATMVHPNGDINRSNSFGSALSETNCTAVSAAPIKFNYLGSAIRNTPVVSSSNQNTQSHYTPMKSQQTVNSDTVSNEELSLTSAYFPRPLIGSTHK